MKKFLSLVLALAMVSSLAACGSSSGSNKAETPGDSTDSSNTAAATYNFAVATNTSQDSNNHEMVQKFADLLAEKSNGTVTATLYEAGALGGDAEMTQGIINGSIDFIIGNPATVVDYVPAAAIFDLPAVYSDLDTVRAVLSDEDLLAELRTAYSTAGIALLSFGDSGYRITSSNKKVETMADFSGIKIRTMNNNNHIAYWQALGANPTPMDFNEVYTCLEQHTLDAQENPYDLIYSSKFYECQDYVIETNHLPHVLELIGSQSVMDKLPEDIQSLVYECAAEAAEYERQVADDRIGDEKKVIEDSGTEIIVLSDDVHAAMAEAAAPIYELVRKQAGEDLVNLVLDLAAKYSK
jgi:tripartite ATP-independent transporter DctP family solute receptor